MFAADYAEALEKDQLQGGITRRSKSSGIPKVASPPFPSALLLLPLHDPSAMPFPPGSLTWEARLPLQQSARAGNLDSLWSSSSMAKLHPSTKYSQEEQVQGGSGAQAQHHGHSRPASAAVQVQVFAGATPPCPFCRRSLLPWRERQ